MQFQYDFMGGSVPQNTGLLVCDTGCLDDLAWQFKLLILPPDPQPFFNTRPENYVVDETNWLVDGIGANGVLATGDIITTGTTSDNGAALITSQPNPADNADTAVLVLTASLSYSGTLSVAYLDLFNGNPASGATSILATITGSATRTNVFSSLEANGEDVLVNPDVLTVTSSAEAISNIAYVGIYDAATAGTLLASGTVGTEFPPIVAGAAVQFNALGLRIAQV